MQYPPPRAMSLDWVATPPPGSVAPPSARRFRRYVGPPSYRTPPRWGFPALAWRWQTAVATGAEPVSTAERLRARSQFAVVLSTALAGFALFSAAAEVWRYILLLRARTTALPRATVDLSDTFVTLGSVLAMITAAFTIAATVLWLVPARQAAAEAAGYTSARPRSQVALGVLVPGLNLIIPGAILTELEHAALRKPADQRPSPSPLIRWWWASLATGGVLFAVTLLWRLRDHVQARADGVLLTAVTDLAAATTAVLTALVILRLTALLMPIDPTSARRMRVIKVDGAPPPPLRTHRTPGASR